MFISEDMFSVLVSLTSSSTTMTHRFQNYDAATRVCSYCHAWITQLSLSWINGCYIGAMQKVMNAVVHHMHDHVTSIMRALHWLPIKICIRYKLCIVMHVAVYSAAPSTSNTKKDLLVLVPTLT